MENCMTATPIGFAGTGCFVRVELSLIAELEARLHHLPAAGDPAREGELRVVHGLLAALKHEGMKQLADREQGDCPTASMSDLSGIREEPES